MNVLLHFSVSNSKYGVRTTVLLQVNESSVIYGKMADEDVQSNVTSYDDNKNVQRALLRALQQRERYCADLEEQVCMQRTYIMTLEKVKEVLVAEIDHCKEKQRQSDEAVTIRVDRESQCELERTSHACIDSATQVHDSDFSDNIHDSQSSKIKMDDEPKTRITETAFGAMKDELKDALVSHNIFFIFMRLWRRLMFIHATSKS